MHVLAPRPSEANLPLFFNVDAPVGLGGHNTIRADILLVQFFLKLIGDTQRGGSPRSREVIATLRGVTPHGRCDEATMNAIGAFQEMMKAIENLPRLVVDGKVSVARGYLYAGNPFTIVSLNVYVRGRTPDHWPRLQDFPGCPPELADAARNAL